MQKAKETASDMAASAKAGMEKAGATVGGKAEKWTTGDPMRKEMAEEKKDERILEAEREKQGAYDQNATARRTQQGATGFTTGGGQECGQYPATGAMGGGADTRARAPGVLDPDVGGQGLMDDDDIDRPAMGTGGAGTRRHRTRTGATF